MQIIFDHVSVKAASTTSHRLKVNYQIHGRAYNDAFDAKFKATYLPREGIKMQFVDANIKSELEKEWRDALASAVKVMVRDEVRRFIREDIPKQLLDSLE